MVAILSWIAIVLLSISYWFQIFKIYRRKEANDLSILYHVCLAVGFGMLTYTAYIEDSTIFLAKQIMTTIPVLILIGQIFYFDRYYKHQNRIMTESQSCENCNTNLNLDWNFCSLCGIQTESPPYQKNQK